MDPAPWRAFDGLRYSEAASDATVILNRAPGSFSLDFPGYISVNQDLVVAVSEAAEDPDQDSVSYTFEWYLRGGGRGGLQPL